MSNLLTRDDTLFGICQAIGDDFGFNPLWLRFAFGASLLANPAVVVGTYAALGLLVLVSRLAFPDGKAAEALPEVPAVVTGEAYREPLREAA